MEASLGTQPMIRLRAFTHPPLQSSNLWWALLMEKGGRLHFPTHFWLPKRKGKWKGIKIRSVDERTLCWPSVPFKELNFTLSSQSKLAKGRVQLCFLSVAYAWVTTGAPGSCVRERNQIAGNEWGQTPSHDPHLHPLFPISASLLLNTPGVSFWNTPTMLLDAAGHIEIVTSGTWLSSPQGLIFNLQPNRFPSHRPSLHSPTLPCGFLSPLPSKANWGAECLTGNMSTIASSSSRALWISLGLTADKPGCLPLEQQQWKPLCNWLWVFLSFLSIPKFLS